MICQILEEDGSIALLPSLAKLAERQGLKILSVASLIAYRLRNESLVMRVAEEEFPTLHGGKYKAIVYRNVVDGAEHMALVKGEITSSEQRLGSTAFRMSHRRCVWLGALRLRRSDPPITAPNR